MNINRYLNERKKLVDKNILKFLPKGAIYTRTLRDAAAYALTTGGKRIRPIFVMEACEAVSGESKKALPMAMAIEMIHTYTLVHDDLPAMDDDDIRRGFPTVHRKFGEDAAILAGDLLNTLAFEIIARSYRDISSRLITELSTSLGLNGVVGGQMADLEADKGKPDLKKLQFIHTRKTAELFVSSIRCGAIIGGATHRELAALTVFARRVGLAFQIIDDIFDYGRDSKSGYPAILGLDRSKKAADREIKLALKALPHKGRFDVLKRTALYLADRKA